MGTNALSKLDSQTRHLLSELEDASDTPSTVGVFVRGSRPFLEADLDSLRAHGAVIRSVAGDVLTADAPPAKIPELARPDFVMQIQASTPLYPEGAKESASSSADLA